MIVVIYGWCGRERTKHACTCFWADVKRELHTRFCHSMVEYTASSALTLTVFILGRRDMEGPKEGLPIYGILMQDRTADTVTSKRALPRCSHFPCRVLSVHWSTLLRKPPRVLIIMYKDVEMNTRDILGS